MKVEIAKLFEYICKYVLKSGKSPTKFMCVTLSVGTYFLMCVNIGESICHQSRQFPGEKK